MCRVKWRKMGVRGSVSFITPSRTLMVPLGAMDAVRGLTLMVVTIIAPFVDGIYALNALIRTKALMWRTGVSHRES